MKRYIKFQSLLAFSMAIVAIVSVANFSHALPGPAPAETAIAEYDPATGRIVVSYTNVSNWFIDTFEGSVVTEVFTGPDDVSSVLPLHGGLLSDSLIRVGEWKPGGDISNTDIDLGLIAMTDIHMGDLRIGFNGPGFGSEVMYNSVVYLGGPMFDPADLNQDGFVDGLDLGIQLGNWGKNVTPLEGELNGVVPVDGLDLGILLGAWDPPAVASVGAVPEPSSIALVALSCLSLCVARRTRS